MRVGSAAAAWACVYTVSLVRMRLGRLPPTPLITDRMTATCYLAIGPGCAGSLVSAWLILPWKAVRSAASRSRMPLAAIS